MAGSSNTPREIGQGSAPPAFPNKHNFTKEELSYLNKRFGFAELHWAKTHYNAPTGEFLNTIIKIEKGREMRRQPAPQPAAPPPEYQPTDSDLDIDEGPIRQCYDCKNLSLKSTMVKCRGKCGYWFDPWCQGEPNRRGRRDPHFRFWRCFQCCPEQRKDPGYKFRYYSPAEIEADAHYEDTDAGIYGTDVEDDE